MAVFTFQYTAQIKSVNFIAVCDTYWLETNLIYVKTSLIQYPPSGSCTNVIYCPCPLKQEKRTLSNREPANSIDIYT